MANYKLSQEAKIDLKRIYRRGVLEFGEQQAEKYIDAMFSRFEAIAMSPNQYQAIDHVREGYRRSPCGSDNIYYRIKNGTVEIMNIIGRQDLDELLKNN